MSEICIDHDKLLQALGQKPDKRQEAIFEVLAETDPKLKAGKISDQNTRMEIAVKILLVNLDKVENEGRTTVADVSAIVEVAGRNASSPNIFIDILSTNWDGITDSQRVEVATAIFTNNPHLRGDNQTAISIRGSIIAHAIELAETTTEEDVCKKITELLGEVGGKRAIEGLILLIDRSVAVAESIAALGKAGKDSPKEAIRALLKIKKEKPEIAGQAWNAIRAIANSIAEGTGSKDKGELKAELNQLLKEAGLRRWNRLWVRRAIDYENVTDLRELTLMAARRMQRPLAGERWGAVLTAIPKMEKAKALLV